MCGCIKEWPPLVQMQRNEIRQDWKREGCDLVVRTLGAGKKKGGYVLEIASKVVFNLSAPQWWGEHGLVSGLVAELCGKGRAEAGLQQEGAERLG